MLSDLRYALRILFKSPGFTLITVLALALGIGANTAIFSVVRAVLLSPLPYRAPERLVWIWGTDPKDEIKQEVASYPDFKDWSQQAQSFSAMAGFATASVILGGTEGEPEKVQAGLAVGDLFGVLGVEPVRGRRFVRDENVAGKEGVVLLSHALWQRRFGGDAQIIGRPILVSGKPRTVIGILPRNFEDPNPGERRHIGLWMPLTITDQMRQSRRGDFLRTIARLKPGLSLGQAQGEMQTVAARLAQQYPDTNAGWSTIVQPLHETLTGDVRPALLVLTAAVAFLLLIACANVANLVLARATARQREIAIRAALGASRVQVIRQLLIENLVLSLAGGAFGLLLAFWGLDALVALDPGNIPRLDGVAINPLILLFTLALSLATGLVFGLAPALTLSKPRLSDSLKEGGRGIGEGAAGRRLRNALAIAEIALSLVLLVGAGLLIRSFVELERVHPGFAPDHVLTAQLSLPSANYGEDPKIAAFYEQLLSRIAPQPGIEAVAVTSALPLVGNNDYLAFTVEGKVPAPNERQPDAESRAVSPDYFRALHIPLRRGRLFEAQDGKDAPPVVVISETLARSYFGKDDPLGKRVTFGDPSGKDPKWQIVIGIVGDVHGSTLADKPYAQIYRPFAQSPRSGAALLVRTQGDPMAFAPSVRQEVQSLDRLQPLSNIQTLEQVLADSIARPRFTMVLIAILAGVAVVLAALGIYGVISYSVTQRTHEIGIRMALGATRGSVLGLVARQGIILAGAGLFLGLLIASGLTRLMASLLYGISASDPLTFAGIPLLLGAIALLASYIPGLRATKVDPVIALRYE